MHDEQLVIQAKNGDDDAFYEFIQNHKASLYRIAYAYFKNEQDALEAIQEVTCRAYHHIHKLKQPQFAATWLTRIMINYCADERRKRRRVQIHAEVSDLQPVTDRDRYQMIEVEQAVDQLNEKYRQVIILKYFEDLKIKDIAQALNQPEGTVKTRLNKGLRLLRRALGEKGGERNA